LLQRYIDDQYRRPRGPVGWYIGRSMARQHVVENHWTVAQLDLAPNSRVLELGFGPGVAVGLCAARVTEGLVAGVDLSRTMVADARRRNAAAVRAGRVSLQHGDAANLPFADATFDRVFGIHTLYFWRDPDRVLREARRVLAPGGRLVLTILPHERWPRAEGQTTLGTRDCRVYTGEDVARRMIAAGFTSPRIADDPEQRSASNYSIIGTR
jgi:SAM-dependent methyltransferase